MEITINLTIVLYVVLAYLVVGYVVMLSGSLHHVFTSEHNSAGWKKKNVIASLYRSLLFSWSFPIALATEIPDTLKRNRMRKMRDGRFVDENGSPLSYKDIYKAYGALVDAGYEHEHTIGWTWGKEDKIYKFAKETYTMK